MGYRNPTNEWSFGYTMLMQSKALREQVVRLLERHQENRIAARYLFTALPRKTELRDFIEVLIELRKDNYVGFSDPISPNETILIKGQQ